MIIDKRKMLYTEPDAVLSATSENTVQNKVIKTAIDTKANIAQEDWIMPTLLNGWANVSGHPPLQYRKNTLNEVEFRGRAYGGVSGSVVCSVPTGYKLSYSKQVIGTTNAYNTILLTMDATGNLTAQFQSVTTYIDFSSLRYFAEE